MHPSMLTTPLLSSMLMPKALEKESAKSIQRARGLDGVNPHGTILCSDGAKVYRTLCYTKGIKHLSCSHRQGQFVIKKRINNQTVHVHTGTIDNVWNMIKKSLPASLTTKDSKKPSCLNRKIWQHVRAWQWRWENSTSHNLSHLTASTFMKSQE